jgi:hypothetical protein
MVNNYCSASCRDDTGGFFILIMFGVKNSREPIKGEFAKKLLAEVQKMMELKKSGTFRNKDHKTKHNIIWKDES